MKQKTIAAVAIIEGLILLVLLANALGLFNFLTEFRLSGCGGEIYATAQSPDKSLTAYAFERDCGATTDSTTFLIVRDSKQKLDLTKDLISDEILFSAEGIFQPKLKWTSKHNLQVIFNTIGAPKIAEVHFQVVKQGDVAVEYRGVK